MSPSLDHFDPERWAELEKVLDVALELEPNERAPYIDRACRGDAALKREVIALLDADRDAQSFLSMPGVPPGSTVGYTTLASGLPTAEAPAFPAPPERIGPYVVESEIGRGGMGVVYHGTDPVRHRSVAIKAIGLGRPDEPEYLHSVLREAKLLTWLQHPNVARIYGIERENGVPYLIIERIDGQSLAQRLEHGALSVAETIDVGRQIADALGAAHGLGIIHRDVKPANVMLTPGGLAKVLDFGVARHIAPTNTVAAGAAPAALPGGSMTTRWGTPGYMSPEQIMGRETDVRADAFAFGCVLYECLAGTCPFARESVLAMITATMRGEVDWDRLPPDTPDSLRQVLTALLQRDPNDRSADMPQIASDLAAIRDTLGGRSSAAPVGRSSTTRLPATPLELIGRDRERDAVERLLERSRIVTLTGPPGVGKTRLAIELASRFDVLHPGDVWYVDLTSVRDENDFDAALRGALGASAGQDPVRGLTAAVADRPALLVLDDAPASGAMLADTTSALAACPGLVLLATSPERLGVDGEQAFRIPPLAVPDPETHRTPESVAGCASIALLVAVARSVRPGFRIDGATADAGARIARAVDGLPLALELAGAMLRDDTTDVVATRLEQAASPRAAQGGRLETLLHVSHAGLLDDERALFADLSQFSGGWTLDAAVAVCGTDGDPFAMLDLLTRLVEKSFVVIERGDRVEPRYRYLEPIRSFAVHRREASATALALRRRHVDYFAALAERLSSGLSQGRADPRWLAVFQSEHANLLEAIRSCEHDGDAMTAMNGRHDVALLVDPRHVRAGPSRPATRARPAPRVGADADPRPGALRCGRAGLLPGRLRRLRDAEPRGDAHLRDAPRPRGLRARPDTPRDHRERNGADP